MSSRAIRGVVRSTFVLVAAVFAVAAQAASARAGCPDEAVREQQHSTYLPDCRAFELVSPPNKNGGDVIASSLRTWAAEDGDAVAFASLTGFGDVAGTGIATDYMAERVAGEPPFGSQGWSVHAITPRQGTLPNFLLGEGFEPMDVLFTPNLDASVYQSWDPLTSDPSVASVANLYLRRNIRSAPSPSIELATACPWCTSSNKPLAPYTPIIHNMLPKIAGLSADGTHVLFESVLKLTGEAIDGTESSQDTENGQVNLYEYANGAVQDVGILPDGTPAAGAVAGQGVGAGGTQGPYMPRAISDDGTHVAFTASPAHCKGGSPPLSDRRYICGDLYLRDTSSTPETSVQVNASERTTPAAGPRPAAFWTMSADGQRVFFTTEEQLTNDDTNTTPDLYMFDASAPAGKRLTRISVQDAGIVLGASKDGHTVYFTSGGGIDVWRDSGSGPPQLRGAGAQEDPVENEIEGSDRFLDEEVESRVSADGRFLLFATPGANCHTGSVVDCRELYRYDADASTPQLQLQCVSCRPDGAPPTTGATDVSRESVGGSQAAGIFNHPLTADGRVFFTTAEALVPEDVNGMSDVYEWEDGKVYLLSDGQSSSGGSFFMDASPDGGDVFVATNTQLSGWDKDNSYDLYDVREPLAGHPAGVFDPPPPACMGDECVGSLFAPPPVATFSSVAFAGAGNVRQAVAKPVRCKAGTVRKHTSSGVRCVRKPKQRKQVRCPRSRAHRKKCSKAAARGGRNGRTR